MKPHEETWESDGGCLDLFEPYTSHVGQFGDFGERLESVDISYARARLAAQAPAMARLLLKLARHVAPGSLAACTGHEEHDELVSVLRAAGVVE